MTGPPGQRQPAVSMHSPRHGCRAYFRGCIDCPGKRQTFLSKEPSAERGQHVVVPDRHPSLLPLPGTHPGPRLTAVVRHLQVLAGYPQTAASRVSITDCGYYWRFSADWAKTALPFCVVCCSLAPPFSTPTPYIPPRFAPST